MSKTQLDLTGLTSEQISQVEAFIEHLRRNSKNESQEKKMQKKEDKELQQLHKEFDWLIADIGIKNSLHRSDIYGIES